MKKKDLEKRLRSLGWRFERHGGSHDAWTNGVVSEFIPRHAEVKENLAKKILKKAEGNPPQNGK
ncbi:MAG TPA: type II toxin-antitoxin system HicA family toxin [Chlamydiales bacterium]|nr:type II toxin-antitoxin system HicA family toxin [Chlamydiales bacterium]